MKEYQEEYLIHRSEYSVFVCLCLFMEGTVRFHLYSVFFGAIKMRVVEFPSGLTPVHRFNSQKGTEAKGYLFRDKR